MLLCLYSKGIIGSLLYFVVDFQKRTIFLGHSKKEKCTLILGWSEYKTLKLLQKQPFTMWQVTRAQLTELP